MCDDDDISLRCRHRRYELPASAARAHYTFVAAIEFQGKQQPNHTRSATDDRLAPSALHCESTGTHDRHYSIGPLKLLCP